MTTKTWNGSNGNFTDANSWSPAGVPVAGDVAVINAGTVAVPSSPSGVTIQLVERSGGTAATTLALNGIALDASVSLVTNSQNNYNSVSPTLAVTGASSLAGTDSFYGTKATFSIAGGSSLTNNGTMNFYSAGLFTVGGGTLVNNGTIAIVNPAAQSQYSVLNDALTGTGTVALGRNARIEIGAAVGSGQTLLLNDGTSGNEVVQLDQVGTFAGRINGFSSSDLISVTNTTYTNASYTSTGANSGTLSLFNGTTLQGSIAFTGQYTLFGFSFNYNDFGNGQSNLQITTSAANAQSGGLPSGFQNGGNGALPVYRFFSQTDGTHFFTANSGERDAVKATRADYVQETNNFGDVAQTDPNATAIYRFFDTRFGTHFFTSSASERDTVIATRSDLTYEPTSTFYEHSTQQSGDVAVYRLFDSRTGTQFLTGDQGEYNGLTTAGTSTYRADLRTEGVVFYAPTGSFV